MYMYICVCTLEKFATISCTSDLIGAMYITLNPSILTDPSEFKCLLISRNIHNKATLVFPAPYVKGYKCTCIIIIYIHILYIIYIHVVYIYI